MKPKVLVYIPVRTGIDFVKECLDSVVTQTYSKQSIWMSFNGCEDGTIEYVQKHYPMVNVLTYPVSAAWNPGITEVLTNNDCDVYCKLGIDDKLVSNYWETVLPLFEANVGFVRVGCYQFSDAIPEGSYWKPIAFNEPQEILAYNKVFFSSPIRKVVWESIGGYDPKIPLYSDWDFWIRAVMKGWKWKTLDKPMFWYRRHPKALSYTKLKDEKKDERAIREKYKDFYKQFPHVLKY